MSQGPSTWGFISLGEYRAPAGPASGSTTARLLLQWRRLGRLLVGGKKGDGAGIERGETPPSELLEALAPEPDRRQAAEGLAAACEDRLRGSAHGRVVAVVGPPGSGIAQILAEVASATGWPVLDGPGRAALLESPRALETVAGNLESVEGPAVLSGLERYTLRHESVLEPLRGLFSSIAARRAPVVLGCDSWAWAFLCHATGLGELTGEALAPRPLAATDLEGWLGAPMRRLGIHLRTLGDGESVIPGADGPRGAGSPPRVLERIAAAARGNPGVARAIWLRALRAEGDGAPAAVGNRERTLWIEPHPEAGLPGLPERPATEDLLALHALLLHAGLSRQLLAEVLPLRSGEVAGVVERLLRRSVLEESDDLTVSAAAYPGVRDHLAAEGFLVDDF